MVEPVVTAAAITAGAQLAGGLLSGRGGGSKQNRQFTADFAKWELSERRKDEADRYSRIVRGARKAGLHPLFALGAGGGSSGGTSVSVGGSSPSGSYLGEGIARAGATIGRGITASGINKRAEELHNLTMARGGVALERDQVELMQAVSELKRMEQLANITRPAIWPAGAQPGGESVTYPMGTRSGVPLKKRPLTNTSRTSIPAFVEMVGPAGRRMIRNPDIGDELAEVDTMVRPWMDMYEAYMGRGRFNPKYPVSKSGYYYWKQRAKRAWRKK